MILISLFTCKKEQVLDCEENNYGCVTFKYDLTNQYAFALFEIDGSNLHDNNGNGTQLGMVNYEQGENIEYTVDRLPTGNHTYKVTFYAQPPDSSVYYEGIFEISQCEQTIIKIN